MLNIITFILGFVAFILTSLQVRGIVPRDLPYALISLTIIEFMWGIKSFKKCKSDSIKLFLGATLCGTFCFIWIFNSYTF